MGVKILFISQGESFMGKSIQKKLEGMGFDIVQIEPVDDELVRHKDVSEIYVFCLGKFLDEIPRFLFRLEDICAKEFKSLILLGSASELNFVQERMDSSAITEKIQRPIDFKHLEHELNRLAGHSEGDETPIEELPRQKSLLLVDDDPTFLKVMKNWLDKDYSVTIVTSGTQALMYLADHKPDLILLDYEMPVTSGPQVLEMIRSETNVGNVPVIFLTGKGDRDSVMKVLALKPDGYLLKSLNREQILASVKDFFSKSQ